MVNENPGLSDRKFQRYQGSCNCVCHPNWWLRCHWSRYSAYEKKGRTQFCMPALHRTLHDSNSVMNRVAKRLASDFCLSTKKYCTVKFLWFNSVFRVVLLLFMSVYMFVVLTLFLAVTVNLKASGQIQLAFVKHFLVSHVGLPSGCEIKFKVGSNQLQASDESQLNPWNKSFVASEVR